MRNSAIVYDHDNLRMKCYKVSLRHPQFSAIRETQCEWMKSVMKTLPDLIENH